MGEVVGVEGNFSFFFLFDNNINADICSAEQIKDNLYSPTDLKNENGSYDRRKAGG